VTAAVVAILNLKAGANLGMMWLSPPLLIVGIALVGLARAGNKPPTMNRVVADH